MVSAYLLVTHGSRDLRPGLAMQELAIALKNLGVVGIADLELSAQPLSVQIQAFAEYASDLGYKRIVVSPLFLLAGVHVMEDIPTQVEIARVELKHKINIDIDVKTHFGADPRIEDLVKSKYHHLNSLNTSPQPILLAHGSRRFGGKRSGGKPCSTFKCTDSLLVNSTKFRV